MKMKTLNRHLETVQAKSFGKTSESFHRNLNDLRRNASICKKIHTKLAFPSFKLPTEIYLTVKR
jgi:hypothetical protein